MVFLPLNTILLNNLKARVDSSIITSLYRESTSLNIVKGVALNRIQRGESAGHPFEAPEDHSPEAPPSLYQKRYNMVKPHSAFNSSLPLRGKEEPKSGDVITSCHSGSARLIARQ